MFAGSAGDLLPSFPKSSCLCTTWTHVGPDSTKYGNNPNGWLDTRSFTEWFQFLIRKIKKLCGCKKIVICDNVVLHFFAKRKSTRLSISLLIAATKDNPSMITFQKVWQGWRKCLSEWTVKRLALSERMIYWRFQSRRWITTHHWCHWTFKKVAALSGIYPCPVEQFLKRISHES